MTDSLRDPYPLGWVLTYRDPRPTGHLGDGMKVGIVAGTPIRDSETGIESFPLSPAGGAAPGPAVWVSDEDIIGIKPSWDLSEQEHG